MTDTIRPHAWQNPNPNRPLPAPHGRHPAPASEAHKRGLADDFRKTPEEVRATFLRRVACAQHKDAYKGRMSVLYEVIDAAYDTAKDMTDLDALMQTIQADLTARKEGAALLNADTPPGVRAGILANRVRLGKTSPVVLGREETVKRETKSEPLQLEKKRERPDHNLFIAPGFPVVPDQSAAPAKPLDEFVPPAAPSEAAKVEPPAEEKPVCKNEWALVPEKQAAFEERMEYTASLAGVDMAHARNWALTVLGVSDETQIAMTAAEALRLLKAAVPAKPEQKPEPEPKSLLRTEAEKPISAVDTETGEILEAAIIPYEPVRAAVERVKTSVAILQGVRPMLIKDVDFGVIPGTGTKPVLLKPGAEKLVNAFNLCPEFEIADAVKTWDTDKPLFYFQYRCKLVDISTGKTIATGLGSCNSMESKYRWRWLWKNQLEEQGIDPEGLTTRKTRNGSTQYRVPNDDMFSQINTLDKMAQKRALIAAVLIGCNASRDFTQDIEDSDFNAA